MIESKKIAGEFKISESAFSEKEEKIKNIFDFKNEIEKTLDEKTTEMLELILSGAIILNMSDIHIEPEEEKMRLRGRVDGMLQDIVSMDLKAYKPIVSRIKVLAKLKLNISDRPQDGRFSVVLKKTEIEMRVSVLPAEYGEAIVLRVLNPKNLINMEDLGIREDLIETFRRELKRPTGMIIVTGPTGAGKTTTLYAVLKKINEPEIKIITIEDPIEYHLEGLSQTQVNSKKAYTFANGLRSIMRQDPNVILVGEIRDSETAKIAVQAALTGHLVFSTVHTNDASGAIIRLLNLGADPSSVASALNVIVAQRLPRRVCEKCAESVYLPEKEREIKEELKDLPEEMLPPSFFEKKLEFLKAKGCRECGFIGYKGRVGIYEMILFDDEMKKFVISSPSIVEIKKKAIEKGMVPLRKDGLVKVAWGVTTIEEIERVAG